jgi:hypothetical protein
LAAFAAQQELKTQQLLAQNAAMFDGRFAALQERMMARIAELPHRQSSPAPSEAKTPQAVACSSSSSLGWPPSPASSPRSEAGTPLAESHALAEIDRLVARSAKPATSSSMAVKPSGGSHGPPSVSFEESCLRSRDKAYLEKPQPKCEVSVGDAEKILATCRYSRAAVVARLDQLTRMARIVHGHGWSGALDVQVRATIPAHEPIEQLRSYFYCAIRRRQVATWVALCLLDRKDVLPDTADMADVHHGSGVSRSICGGYSRTATTLRLMKVRACLGWLLSCLTRSHWSAIA